MTAEAYEVGDILTGINGKTIAGSSADAVYALLDAALSRDGSSECGKGQGAGGEAAQQAQTLTLTLLRKLGMPDLSSDEIVVCANEQRTQVVLAAALAMGLPYVPFRAVFVEGDLTYGGSAGLDNPGDTVRMLPTWLSLGDYDNILGTRCLMTRCFSEPEESDLCVTKLKALPESPGTELVLSNELLPGSEDERSSCRSYSESEVMVGLQAAPVLKDSGIARYLLNCLGAFREHDGYKENYGLPVLPVVAFPGGDDDIRAFDSSAGTGSATSTKKKQSTPSTKRQKQPFVPDFDSDYFHIDSKGNTCFSASEASLAAERVRAMNLLRYAKASINSLDLHLPQVSSTMSTEFCNESVYGKVNVLMVTGIVRLGFAAPASAMATAAPAAATASGDAKKA
jgi:hypothetical protein